VTSTIDRDERHELIRAGVEMALYIALSLLAVIVALPLVLERTEVVAVATTLIVTAVGLLAAHWLAFSVSARLETGGIMSREALAELGAQVGGGAIAVAIAVVPILVVPPPQGVLASQLALLALIAGVAYAAARPRARSRVRALAYTAAVVLGSAVVVALHDLGGH
jgi:hypothetical protein